MLQTGEQLSATGGHWAAAAGGKEPKNGKCPGPDLDQVFDQVKVLDRFHEQVEDSGGG